MWCLQENQVIGMTSHAVVEARHGLILCTAWYSTFCKEADGQFLHHHPTAALRSDIVGGLCAFVHNGSSPSAVSEIAADNG
jgi:hypothetical protein